MKNTATYQEKGFAFGQAVTISSELLKNREQSFIESTEGKNQFKTNVKALYHTILEVREEIREEEDNERMKVKTIYKELKE